MVARLTGGEEVAGSNPVVPTILLASKSVGAEVGRLKEAERDRAYPDRLLGSVLV